MVSQFFCFFSLAAIYLLLRVKFKRDIGKPILMGFCLFSAYLCRPTLALLAPIYLVSTLLLDRSLAVKAAVALFLFLMIFVGFSLHEFNQILPDYYLPQRLGEARISTALYGNLLSPARGLLVYSPFLIVPIVGVAFLGKSLSKYKSETVLAIWPGLHWFAISHFPHWWAGYSYGSRLMMDVLPGLFVLLVVYLARSPQKLSLRWISFIGLGLIAIWINTCQGLFNRSTAEWNAQPSIDEFPEYLFDWRYPQFMSTPAQIKQRMAQHEIEERETEANPPAALVDAMNRDLAALDMRRAKESAAYTAQLMKSPTVVSRDYDFRCSSLYFIGWGQPESLFRWSVGHHAEILFYLEPDAPGASTLVFTAFALYHQRFRLLLNGNSLGIFDIGATAQTLTITVRPSYFRAGVINALHFELPGARQPPNGDTRALALAFQKMKISE